MGEKESMSDGVGRQVGIYGCSRESERVIWSTGTCQILEDTLSIGEGAVQLISSRSSVPTKARRP